MDSGIEKLLKVMAAMRSEHKGCPWDRSQTHETLIPYFKEELAEFLDCLRIDGPDSPKTWEELGDVLFQVVFHAQLLMEKNLSSFDVIAGKLAQKLIDRHPHVFDPQHPGFKTSEEVNLAWQELKKRSAHASATAKGGVATRALKDIPKALGALQISARMGEKMASYGFDWPTAPEAWQKVEEELIEVKQATSDGHLKEELGDLLFGIAQFCRKKGWDPEEILQDANRKFESRIQNMDRLIDGQNCQWKDFDLTQLEQLWQQSKGNKNN